MDRRERSCTDEEKIRLAFDGMKAGFWSAMPAIIQSFNPAAMTVVAQPSIMGRVRGKDGKISYVNMPLLVDVPVHFPSGGGFSLTFPIAEGDEALIVFADRCIDSWWQSGGIQQPMELRMHDLSDGFAFVGVFSQPRVLGGISTGTTQLRSDDGETFVEVAGDGIVNVKAPTKILLDTPLVEVKGVMHVINTDGEATSCSFEGDINVLSGDVTADAISLKHHTHPDVQSGSGNTGEAQ